MQETLTRDFDASPFRTSKRSQYLSRLWLAALGHLGMSLFPGLLTGYAGSNLGERGRSNAMQPYEQVLSTTICTIVVVWVKPKPM